MRKNKSNFKPIKKVFIFEEIPAEFWTRPFAEIKDVKVQMVNGVRYFASSFNTDDETTIKIVEKDEEIARLKKIIADYNASVEKLGAA